MIGIIIKVLIGLFIWLALGEILCTQFKMKKHTKTFINIACKIVGIMMVIFAGMGLVKILLDF